MFLKLFRSRYCITPDSIQIAHDIVSIAVQTGSHSQGITSYNKTVRWESDENIFVTHLTKMAMCKAVVATDERVCWAISYLSLSPNHVGCLFLKTPQPTFPLHAS